VSAELLDELREATGHWNDALAARDSTAVWRAGNEMMLAASRLLAGCDGLRDERDAAIRRAEELSAALREVVDHDPGLGWDGWRETGVLRDIARAALRSQESQKPPETEDR